MPEGMAREIEPAGEGKERLIQHLDIEISILEEDVDPKIKERIELPHHMVSKGSPEAEIYMANLLQHIGRLKDLRGLLDKQNPDEREKQEVKHYFFELLSNADSELKHGRLNKVESEDARARMAEAKDFIDIADRLGREHVTPRQDFSELMGQIGEEGANKMQDSLSALKDLGLSKATSKKIEQEIAKEHEDFDSLAKMAAGKSELTEQNRERVRSFLESSLQEIKDYVRNPDFDEYAEIRETGFLDAPSYEKVDGSTRLHLEKDAYEAYRRGIEIMKLLKKIEKI